jgi:hypothetical protein
MENHLLEIALDEDTPGERLQELSKIVVAKMHITPFGKAVAQNSNIVSLGQAIAQNPNGSIHKFFTTTNMKTPHPQTPNPYFTYKHKGDFNSGMTA